MTLKTWKKSRMTAATSLATLVCFLATLLPPRVGRADVLPPINGGTGGPQSTAGSSSRADAPESLATVDLATGAAHANYVFELPAARGDAQPSLALRYNSSSGLGVAGMGWTLNLASIVRKGHAGIPRFQDAAIMESSTHGSLADPNADDYYIDGQLLIPVAIGNQALALLPQSISSFEPQMWTVFRRESMTVRATSSTVKPGSSRQKQGT
jgi:hypothetical protein